MTARKRSYGSMQDPYKLSLLVERSVSVRLSRMAMAAGVSKAVMLEWIIQNIELDDDDVPVGWPQNDELPMPRAG